MYIVAYYIQYFLDNTCIYRFLLSHHLSICINPIILSSIDEGSSVKLCGLYRDYEDGMASHDRRQYPWLAKISVTVGIL